MNEELFLELIRKHSITTTIKMMGVSTGSLHRYRLKHPKFNARVEEIRKGKEHMNNIISAYPRFNHVAKTLEFLGIRIHEYNKLRIQDKEFAKEMDALRKTTKEEAYKYHKPARDYNPVMLGWAPPRVLE